MGSNPAELVMELSEMGISRGPILDAVRYVPRPVFVPPDYKKQAWENRPLPIGSGQTISQPYTVARMLELANVHSDGKVLEVGCGSGYAAALAAYVVGDMGAVTAIEAIAPLAVQAAETLRKIGLAKILVVQGDGKTGHPPRAPYDSIIVSAQSPEIPESLLEQLDDGGSLVMPVGTSKNATMTRVVRRKDELTTTHHGAFAFVPLL